MVSDHWKRRKKRENKRCLSCDKLISRAATRCKPCSQRGALNSAWYKTGKTYGHGGGSGYVVLSGYFDHPNARADGTIFEHVAVMSKMIGRPLLGHENVHHKNGVRDDNRPENLELWSTSQPSGQRVIDKTNWAIEILRLYKPEALVISSLDELSERGQ